MGFLGLYRAIYDYAPQAEGELAIGEGDLLYVLEKNEDDGWWKAKRKAGTDEDDEPEGLVPNNYIEPALTLIHARAIYEYTRQTDEELSFPEDALLEVFDVSDPDWILAGLDDEYGFVPSNYIETKAATADDDSPKSADSPPLPMRPHSVASEPTEGPLDVGRIPPTSNGPAAALASFMQTWTATRPRTPSSPAQPARQSSRHDNLQVSEAEDDDVESLRSPALPTRPRSHVVSDDPPCKLAPASQDTRTSEPYITPGGFHMYNINEMVSVMGKRKKIPTTLGINLKTGTILIAPERAQDEPAQEWTADRMTHYSREGKHVFMELVRPRKSIDFHAGAKDTAEEIVGAFGELAGAIRAEGLREVIMAGSQRTRRKGQVLYDFMAQGDDEVTVAAGDEVMILDESKSDEWWQVRRIKNGKEGVVPSSYIEAIGTAVPSPVATNISPTDSARSTVEQNRLEEIRLTKEAIKGSKELQQRGRRENGRRDSHLKAKSKPESSKVRTWTDRSGSFSVEAQFLGLRDGKIHLHKMNGVKIAVPIAKMSRDDLECVENITGISLDDEKPMVGVKRSKSADKRLTEVGASVAKNEKPEYDWFQFFLSCDVAIGLCERYAQAFLRDSMDESVLPDVNATVLRTLGLREGDIIKVMRALDVKFGRECSKAGADGDNATGGLFSGPGGALRNNTRKGRPAPALQTSDVVDASAFSAASATGRNASAGGSSSPSNPPTNSVEAPAASGFDDDAWDVKQQPKKQRQASKESKAAQLSSEPATSTHRALASSIKELSLLTEPLQPTPMEPQQTAVAGPCLGNVQPQQSQQPMGSSPFFFSTVPNPGQVQSSPKALARQRPAPPSVSSNQSSLAAPPPQRSSSAPHSAQQAVFGPPPMVLQATSAVQAQVAPPGQSLHDLAQRRLQQQYAAMEQLQPAMTGYAGFQPQVMAAYPTTAPRQPQFMMPMETGLPGASPFADPGSGRPSEFSPLSVQHTGFQPAFTTGMSLSQGPGNTGGINSFLPPALEPQRTAPTSLHPQPTGVFARPLQPQKTGPPPPVRFGVNAGTKKLTPQPTGRRANLAQATPENPFGF